MVVLEEFTKRDENLANIKDFFNPCSKFYCRRLIVDAEHIPILHPYSRSFDGIDRYHTACLARPLGLHLGADSKELAENIKGRRMKTGCSKPGIT